MGLQIYKNFIDDQIKIAGIEFVWIQHTKKNNSNSDMPISIKDSFWLGKYEVTQAQWEAVMGSNPSHFKGDNLPVENITYEETLIFIEKLNSMGKRKFRLPKYREWLYVYYTGNTEIAFDLGDYFWYFFNSNGTTHQVGLKQPNAWGVYDMGGNVAEYTNQITNMDCIPIYRIMGGSWLSDLEYCKPMFNTDAVDEVRQVRDSNYYYIYNKDINGEIIEEDICFRNLNKYAILYFERNNFIGFRLLCDAHN